MTLLWRVLVVLLTVSISASALSGPTEVEVPIYLFWGEGCPHCAVAKPYLERLAEGDPRIEVTPFEKVGRDVASEVGRFRDSWLRSRVTKK